MSYDSLPPQKYTDEEPILRRTALQAEVWLRVIYPRALPPVTHGSALQAPECLWFLYYHGFYGLDGLDGFTVRGDCALMRPLGLT